MSLEHLRKRHTIFNQTWRKLETSGPGWYFLAWGEGGRLLRIFSHHVPPWFLSTLSFGKCTNAWANKWHLARQTTPMEVVGFTLNPVFGCKKARKITQEYHKRNKGKQVHSLCVVIKRGRENGIKNIEVSHFKMKKRVHHFQDNDHLTSEKSLFWIFVSLEVEKSQFFSWPNPRWKMPLSSVLWTCWFDWKQSPPNEQRFSQMVRVHLFQSLLPFD